MFEKITPGARWWDTQWRHQDEFIRLIGATRTDMFSILHHIRHFCCYYSEKELQFIPVGGWLIPGEYFEKEIIL